MYYHDFETYIFLKGEFKMDFKGIPKLIVATWILTFIFSLTLIGIFILFVIKIAIKLGI